MPPTPTPDLDGLENVLDRIADAVSASPWGAPFVSTMLATLIGVVVGALLSWLFASVMQNRERSDRYAERLDDRNLLWMDALDAFANRLLDEARAFGEVFYGDDEEAKSNIPDRFTPSPAVEDDLGRFRTRIRQAALVARGADVTVLAAIERDVLDNWTEPTVGKGLNPEYYTRMHMLVNEFMNYRRGELHAAWFSYWQQGTGMPFVDDGAHPRQPAPKHNPTTEYRRIPPR